MISDISIVSLLVKTTYRVNDDVGQSRPERCRLDQHVPMDDPKTIGARIRSARIAKDLTQVDLAAAIGVSRAHLTNVEGGNGGLALDKLSILAGETGTTVAWLIGEAPLADSTVVPLDPLRAELLANYDTMNAERRRALLAVSKALKPDEKADEVATPEPVTPRKPRSVA
jgi:transcriptional regulator with XRE-family HTH domain